MDTYKNICIPIYLLLAQVTGALERKEGLMAQVRQMSDEAGSGKHMDAHGGHSDAFQQAYAKAVLELRKVRRMTFKK